MLKGRLSVRRHGVRSRAPLAPLVLVVGGTIVGTTLAALAPAAAAATRPAAGAPGSSTNRTASSSGGSTAVYSSTITIAAPPASTFAGASAGGDGWGVALSAAQVFNVFHHDGQLQVFCHNQADASQCWPAPKTITESDATANNGANFATPGQPGLFLDQASGHLYVFATRVTDLTAGVVCVDTTQPAATADPYCGFTPLSAAGDAQLNSFGWSEISDPVVVGSNWYAMNFVGSLHFGRPRAGATTQDEMMCFSLSSFGACASQPFAVALGTGAVSLVNGQSSPAVAAFGNQVVVPVTVGGTDELACFDPAAAGGTCNGSWPVSLSFSYASAAGAAFPMLSSGGSVTGFCLPTGTDQCYDLAGDAVATPAGLPSVVGGNANWNGTSLTFGPRVYVPNDYSNVVQCFDYSTGSSCTNFPKSFQNLGGLYTVTRDPQRPTCLWVNADNGASQIQNFDAYSAGTCQQNPLRVLGAAVVVPLPLCAPITWDSLQVVAPARSQYTSGTVQFDDGDGNPLPGLPLRQLDKTGAVDLADLNLASSTGLPEFLVSLNNPPANLAAVEIRLTWTADYSPTCLQPGTTAEPADVSLTKAVQSATPTVGAQDSFTLVARNAGPSDAGLVTVTDRLPSGLTYDSSSASAGTVHVSGLTVTWTIPDLGPPGGASSKATLTIAVTVGTTSKVTNEATFTQTTPGQGGVTSGNSNTVAVAPVPVPAVVEATLAIQKTAATSSPKSGSDDQYTVTVTNEGPSTAAGVVVTDSLPSGLSLVSASASVGVVHEPAAGSATVTWDVGSLTDGATAELRLDTKVVAGYGKLTNTAEVTDTTTDPSGQTKTASATVTVLQVVPATHTGESWAGWPYWLLVSLFGAGGIAGVESGRRRASARRARRAFRAG